MTYPTLENPFELMLANFHTPTLGIPPFKNMMVPYKKRNGKLGIRKGDPAKDFFKSVNPRVREAWEAQGFTQIPPSAHVCVWSYVAVYLKDKSKIPRVDLDNQYQTMQETMTASQADVLEDRHIFSFYSQRKLIDNKPGQHGFVWVWVVESDLPLFEEQMAFYKLHQPMKNDAGYVLPGTHSQPDVIDSILKMLNDH